MIGSAPVAAKSSETTVGITFHAKQRPQNPSLMQLEPGSLNCRNEGQVQLAQ
jgi:hypothetical protein